MNHFVETNEKRDYHHHQHYRNLQHVRGIGRRCAVVVRGLFACLPVVGTTLLCEVALPSTRFAAAAFSDRPRRGFVVAEKRRSSTFATVAKLSPFSVASFDATTIMGKRPASAPPLRRSERLRKQRTTTSTFATSKDEVAKRGRATKRTFKTRNDGASVDVDADAAPVCLPRTRERALSRASAALTVVGVDEAGRGPLAGPVVAAAAVVPADVDGVADSKSVTDEAAREALYERIVASPGAVWAVAVIDAKRIDEINILQATMEAMRCAVETVATGETDLPLVERAAASVAPGSYVVASTNSNPNNNTSETDWYALVDGNRVPSDLSVKAEAVVKGDSKEYCIAAASVLAKVTRDRLMREWHELWPYYGLDRHKGYPTAAHMAAVREHGASPIHRRTFAPLKHMEFDDEGRVVNATTMTVAKSAVKKTKK